MKNNIVLIIALCIGIHSFASEKKPFILENHYSQPKKVDASSTNGKLAAGLKFYPLGLTAKYFVKDNFAVEGLAYFWVYGPRITLLGEFHQKIDALSGQEGDFKVYAGGGAHLGFISNYYYNKFDRQYGRSPGAIYVGIDGVLGADYKFSEIPVNVSLDWQPSISFYGFNYLNGFEYGWGGLSVRYVF
jgi:hypothetical protein